MVASAFLDLLAFWTRRKSIEVPIQTRGRRTSVHLPSLWNR